MEIRFPAQGSPDNFQLIFPTQTTFPWTISTPHFLTSTVSPWTIPTCRGGILQDGNCLGMNCEEEGEKLVWWGVENCAGGYCQGEDVTENTCTHMKKSSKWYMSSSRFDSVKSECCNKLVKKKSYEIDWYQLYKGVYGPNDFTISKQ